MNLIFMYIKFMLGYMIVSLPFYLVARFIVLKKNKRSFKPVNEIILMLFVLYLVGLASQTILPKWDMGVITDTGEFFFNISFTNELASVNIIPFHTFYQYIFTSANVSDWGSVSLLNLSANLLLFSPIGFFVPLIWPKFKSFRKVVYLGLSITCLIEFVQFFIGRSTDIDDVILNTLGVFIGYGIYVLFGKAQRAVFGRVIQKSRT
jgi:glycopeptide antibiotics resistance protein